MAPPLLFSPVMRKSILASLLVLAMGQVALADDSTDSTDSKPSTTQPSHADPQTKTLPATASATAQANAFGQQGDRMKAAHQAAKAAASQEAKNAAADHKPASAGLNSHASAHANGHAANGLAHAAAGAGNAHSHPH